MLLLPIRNDSVLNFSSILLHRPACVPCAALHVSTVPRWPPALPPYAKPASGQHPRLAAPPAKQPGPHQTSRYRRPERLLQLLVSLLVLPAM